MGGGRLNFEGLGLLRPGPAFCGKNDDNLLEEPRDGGGGRPCLFGPLFDCLGGSRTGLGGGLLCCC